MKINEKKFNDIVLLKVENESIGEIESREFYKYINDIIAKDCVKFVIDLSNVRWMSSSGLGVLVAVQNAVKEKKGK